MEKDTEDTSEGAVNPPLDREAQAAERARQAAAYEATRKFVQQLAMDLEEGDFDLPPFPDTAFKVQQCIRDPNADNQTLAAIIATEPALAARLMRMANSVAMRRGPIEVTDIPTAISRVGLDMVQNVAAAFAAREAFRATPDSPCIDELLKLRRQGVRVAAIAYLLARQVRGNYKPDEAMLAGLLSAVGKFCIFTKAADYPDLFTDRKSLDQLVAQWHTGVARAIVESWGFPDTVAIAVDEQEVRERERTDSADLSDLLFIANLVARAGIKVAGHLGDLDALARMRIDAARLHALLTEGEEEIQSMASAMA